MMRRLLWVGARQTAGLESLDVTMADGRTTHDERLEKLARSARAAWGHDRLYLEIVASCVRCEAATAQAHLRAGMSLAEARNLLKGWTESPPAADHSPDKTRLYYTADFIPPSYFAARALRLTFDNGKLLVWGESAAVNDQPRRGAAG